MKSRFAKTIAVCLISLAIPLSIMAGRPEPSTPPPPTTTVRYTMSIVTGPSALMGSDDNGTFSGSITGASGARRAVLVTDGSVEELNDMIDPASGWILQTARDINSSGQICGLGTLEGTTWYYRFTPAVYDPSTGEVLETSVVEPIAPLLMGDEMGRMNELGDVAICAGGGFDISVFSGPPGEGVLATLFSGHAFRSFCTGINNFGQVAGSINDGLTRRAFRHTPGETLETFGSLNSNSSYLKSHARDINGFGVWCGEATKLISRKVGTQSLAVVCIDDTLVELGTLGGNSSWAEALNDNGVVVGRSSDGQNVHGFVYIDGGMHKLSELITPSSLVAGLSDLWPYEIDESGDICGVATVNGVQVGFTLTRVSP